jgi:hypothetical protein
MERRGNNQTLKTHSLHGFHFDLKFITNEFKAPKGFNTGSKFLPKEQRGSRCLLLRGRQRRQQVTTGVAYL